MKITIVEDEKNVRLAVSTALEEQGFEVEQFCNGQEALDSVLKNNNPPDLYLLDIMMPVMDGILFMQKYKAVYPQVPAMFLTSRDEEFDRVLGLELGAEDYLCKPFSVKELVARVKVILRRFSIKENPATGKDVSEGIKIDSAKYLAWLDGQQLSLTVTEFRLLEAFMNHEDNVLTREQLLHLAYPEETYLNDRAIDCHIKRLRKKIGGEKIETVYGLGYRFCR